MVDDAYLEIERELKEKSKKRGYDNVFLWIIGIILFPFFCFWLFVRKPHEYISDINNLSEPLQVDTSGGVVKYIDGQYIAIDFLAEYDIQGLVLAKKDYSSMFSNKTVDKIGPRDFVLGWGILGREENMDKFEWYEYGDRFVQASLKMENIDWFNDEFGGLWENAGLYYSNNHLIWSNQKIRLLLKKIKVGDVIRVKGYLVNVLSNQGWSWGPSSLVRDDHGCEIIYVTDIIWLKQ